MKALSKVLKRVRDAAKVATWFPLAIAMMWGPVLVPGLWLGFNSDFDRGFAKGILLACVVAAVLRFLYACIVPPRDPAGERRASLMIGIPMGIFMLIGDAIMYWNYLYPPARQFPC
jgi:hypothetical protein